jgi:hypothetical protein
MLRTFKDNFLKLEKNSALGEIFDIITGRPIMDGNW